MTANWYRDTMVPRRSAGETSEIVKPGKGVSDVTEYLFQYVGNVTSDVKITLEAGFYTYKDGELTEVQALPVPAFDEIFDEDAVDPGNRDLIPRLKANYKERPRDFLTYDVEPFDGTVVARLNPVDAEAEMETGAWLECYWEYRRDYSDTPVYHWNGKAFVK